MIYPPKLQNNIGIAIIITKEFSLSCIFVCMTTNSTIQWVTKPFTQLTPEELYAILRLRSEVFVVEQNCVYQDLDNKDQKALHQALTGATSEHDRDAITLDSEHRAAMDALARAQDARDAMVRTLLGQARQHWPDQWRSLAPLPLRFASWVGYDMDGRTDITWSASLGFRLADHGYPGS